MRTMLKHCARRARVIFDDEPDRVYEVAETKHPRDERGRILPQRTRSFSVSFTPGADAATLRQRYDAPRTTVTLASADR